MKYIFCLISICGITLAQCQNAEPALYKSGYRNLFATDSSRIYKPGSPSGARLHYRPLEIDIWYPAASSSPEPPIEYGQLLRLLEERSNRFQDDTLYRDMTKDLVASLCAGLNIADTSALTHLKTISHENATPIPRRFPLIIYMCSFNGMSYENIHLLENLARHGYVVACITSVGRYPGNMSTDFADLLEQVGDGAFAIGRLKNEDNVDPGKIGLIGYSWGGLAALLLSMNANNITATLSLDGSELHYYGESAEEDRDFDRIRASLFFSTSRMHSVYTYLESDNKQKDRQVDSIFNILPFLSIQKQYIRFPGTTHEDFSSLPMLSAQLIAGLPQEGLSRFDKFSQYYFDEYLKGETKALSADLSEIWMKHADSLYPTVKSLNPRLVIQGRVFDSRDKTPLAYVNVGIPGKNKGTVTRQDGSFTLAIDPEMEKDSLQLSMAGYREQTIKINRNLTVLMGEKITELKEAVVTSRASKTKRLGNTTTSKSMSIGFPMRFLGAELGVRIKLGKQPVKLKSFNFNISASRVDSALFRLNIYSFDKGVVSGNKLEKNILVSVGRAVGLYAVYLSSYDLIMRDDILVSLELIEGSSSGSEPGALFLSAGFLNSATWRRPTSQAAWKKAAGIGVGFNLVVQE